MSENSASEEEDRNQTTTTVNSETQRSNPTTTSGSSSTGGNAAMPPKLSRNAMTALLRARDTTASNPSALQRKEPKKNYAFWGSQPVTQFSDNEVEEEGPIDEVKTVDDVRQEPFNLTNDFEWCTCDVREDEVVDEVYKLLKNNYVEDDDMMFRFDYSPGFLKWALLPPGFHLDWLVGVRVTSNKKLVGFISAIPADIQINGNVKKMVEINFLCVHKKLRSRRLAPVLIKEITRRVNLHDIWQATYTAGVVLPTPITRARYWHRSLNPKKLIDIGFSHLSRNMTMARTIKLFRLPSEAKTKGFRELKKEDCSQVKTLLEGYLSKFKISPIFQLEDIEHWLVPRPGVIYSYVVEDSVGKITDLASFYSLPSSILKHPEYKTLNAGYMYYTVPHSTQLLDLMKDLLIMAKENGFDVFNALDILENETFLKDLKFGEGEGFLQYYLYNWRVKSKLSANEVGLILL